MKGSNFTIFFATPVSDNRHAEEKKGRFFRVGRLVCFCLFLPALSALLGWRGRLPITFRGLVNPEGVFSEGAKRPEAQALCYALCRLRSVKPIKGRQSVCIHRFFLFFIFRGQQAFRLLTIIDVLAQCLDP